jgi:hypothetical protein
MMTSGRSTANKKKSKNENNPLLIIELHYKLPFDEGTNPDTNPDNTSMRMNNRIEEDDHGSSFPDQMLSFYNTSVDSSQQEDEIQ